MAIAPFIRPIQTQGGTFYSFTSASDDLSLTFNNSGKKFNFSKYALLNIPPIKRPIFPAPNEENVVQLDTVPGAFANVTNSQTYNVMLAESLQNYMLNLESMLISFPSYDVNTLHTVSERVFFKWLKEIGAIRFREATSQESNLSGGLLYAEESNSANYTSVVKYVSDIDMVNSLKSIGDAYSEIYINVPAKDGATPLVLFSSTDDNNYHASQNLINSPTDPLNTEFLLGRTSDQTNPSGLTTLAYFDSEFANFGPGATPGTLLADVDTGSLGQGEYQLFKYNESTQQYEVNWWFLYPEANSYWTQPGVTATGTYDTWTNGSYLIRGYKQGVGGTVESVNFRRTDLDGIGLDFNINDYVPISSNPSLRGFSDFNSIPESVSFQFNAVLVYYDVQDVSTGNIATNLFGILFLNDVEDTLTGGSYIPSLDKYKPNQISGLNGNAYGLKINLKFDTNSNQASVVNSVNEYSPFSLHVFLDALNRMQTISNKFLDYQNSILDLSLRVNALNDFVMGGTAVSSINSQIANINTQLQAAGFMFENSTTIMDLIQANYAEILNIYNNMTSVKMAYNLDVLKQGVGISLDKSIPNQIVLTNSNQEYNLSKTPLMNVLTDFNVSTASWSNTIPLLNFTNYVKLSNGVPNAFNKNIYIYIDDTYVTWKAGQSYRIVVDSNFPMDMYTLGSFDLAIFTDALDRNKNGEAYGEEIGRIYSEDFFATAGSPSIEMICIDPTNYTFTFDVKH